MFCIVCHENYPDGAAHYCRGTATYGYAEGAKPLRQLTEEDVRRIVREELALRDAEGDQ